jgi:CRP/FNR family cyclic AMP-dependent transcriptional regulator
MNTVSACIRTCELLSNLPESEVDRISDQLAFRTIRKNTIILSAGDMTDAIYIIDTGKVRVFRENDEGRQITLNTLGPGELFGQLAALAEAPRAASIEALESTRVLVIPKKGFLDLLEHNPGIAIDISKQFAQMVSIMSNHMAEIALLDVYGRLVSFIDRSSTLNVDGKKAIEGYTHQVLANHVGASREMVSRIIGELKKGNYISTSPEKHTITVERRLPSGW